MWKILNIFGVISLLRGVQLQLLPPPTVNLPHGGSLRGTYLYTVQTRVIHAFLGIPYAQPPVGPLRFSDPEPTYSWNGYLEATKKADPCIQYDAAGLDKTPFGSEDCLYLNVYTPRERSSSPILPVMVWIHGGAYYLGSSDPILYGPERLLDNDVILVTINYRLGAFGFLSTETLHAPGNFGLKDQNMALKWIRENIAAFGGNLDDITLFGQSAGAASVSLHMVAPASADLFHKAILQSGNYFDRWAMIRKNKAVERAQQLARYLQCPVPTDKDYSYMINCLRNTDADKIISAHLNFFVFPTADPVTIFGPVVEPLSSTSFLEQDPRDIDNSYGDGIPIIIGVNSDEGLVKSAAIVNQLSTEFQQNFESILPTMLFFDHKSSNTQQKLLKKIKKFYFRNGFDWSRKNHHNLTNLFSDRFFYDGLDQYLKKRLKNPTAADTYVYVFDHNGPKSSTEIYGGGSKFYGVCHGDELAFLFPFGQLGFRAKKRDRQVHWALPKMWTDFAKTGDPTPRDSIITQKWHRATKYPYRYVRIGEQNDNSKHTSHHKNHHRKSPKIENLVAKALDDETNRTPDDKMATFSEESQIYREPVEDTTHDIIDQNFQQDTVESSDKDPTNEDRADEHFYSEQYATEEEPTTTTTTPVPAPRWKNSNVEPKHCSTYTTRDPCAIVNNKKEKFWSGFTY